MGAHVSAIPNHQTGRITPLNTRGVVAMSGTFGYELDMNKMTEEEKEVVKEQVATYKRNFDTINYGKYYRLTNPYSKERFVAWQFVADDGLRSLVNFVLTKPEHNPPIINIKLQGLQPDRKYRVAGTDECYTGAALMKAGNHLKEQFGDYTAVQIELELCD